MPIPTSLDFLPAGHSGIEQASAQVGMSHYGTPANNPYPNPYGPPSSYGSSQVDPSSPKLPKGTLTHEQAGRLINGPVNGNWFDYCGPAVRACYQHVYISTDAWWMHRNDATWKNLAQSGTTGAILGRSRDPDFNLESIPKLTIGKAFCDWTIEANAIYKDDIDAHTDTTAGNVNSVWFGLQPIGSDYRLASGQRFELNDEFHSYEANVINTVEFINWMVGVRYVEFNERLGVVSMQPGSMSNADIFTHNRMLGGQVGLRAKYDWELYGFESNFKFGFYYNDANTGTRVRDFNNTVVIRDAQTNGQNEACLTEFNVIFTYNPTMHFGLRAGYQFMYINEIALAPDQIIPANDGIATGFQQNAKGDMFMHGPMLGAEWKW
ncbi:MAG: BBP7 family outer membrane beta-barrel protein [Pirellulales bacterium]